MGGSIAVLERSELAAKRNALEAFAEHVADKTNRKIYSGAPGVGLSLEQVRGVLNLFLASRCENTGRAYRVALESLQEYFRVRGVEEAVQQLFSMSQGDLNGRMQTLVNDLTQRGRSPATINNRLVAFRELTKQARRLGHAVPVVEQKSLKVERVKDCRGPEPECIEAVLQDLRGDPSPKSRRNSCLLSMLYFCGFRVSEALNLDLPADVDLEKGELRIRAKGKVSKQPIGIPEAVRSSIRRWLEVRGEWAGPLFVSIAKKSRADPQRLIREQAWRICTEYGLGRSHGLRHTAITVALDRTRGDVRSVSRFARHMSVNTTMIYDDSRRDFGKEIGSLIAGETRAKVAPPIPPDAGARPIPISSRRIQGSLRRPPGSALAHRIPVKRLAGTPILCPKCGKDAFVYCTKKRGRLERKRHMACGTCDHRFTRIQTTVDLARPEADTVWTIDRLLSSTPAAISWVWRGYLARGAVTLLGSPPKLGKSTLTFALLRALTTGEPFLGTPIERTPVLVFTEEGRESVREKCAAFGLDATLPLSFVFRPDLAGAGGWAAALAAARRLIDTSASKLLVLDTWASWGFPETNPAAIEEAYRGLKEIAERCSVPVLVLHHTSKAKRAGLTAIRGHSAILGAADICLRLTRGKGSDKMVSGAGRFAEAPPRLRYSLAEDGTLIRRGLRVLPASSGPTPARISKASDPENGPLALPSEAHGCSPGLKLCAC